MVKTMSQFSIVGKKSRQQTGLPIRGRQQNGIQEICDQRMMENGFTIRFQKPTVLPEQAKVMNNAKHISGVSINGDGTFLSELRLQVKASSSAVCPE